MRWYLGSFLLNPAWYGYLSICHTVELSQVTQKWCWNYLFSSLLKEELSLFSAPLHLNISATFTNHIKLREVGRNEWKKKYLFPVLIFTVASKDNWFSLWLTARNPNTAKKPTINWHREGNWMKGIGFHYKHKLKHGLKWPDGSRD